MKRLHFTLFITIFSLFALVSIKATNPNSKNQQKIDSLKSELGKSQNKDSMLYQEIVDQFILLGNIDSAILYNKCAYKFPTFEEDYFNEFKYFYNFGSIHFRISRNIDSVIYYYEKSNYSLGQIRNRPSIDNKLIFNQYSRLSDAYSNKSLQTEALNYGKKALEVATKINDSLLIVNTLLNIGYLETDLGLQVKGIERLHEGLRISKKIHNEQYTARFFMAIGYNYFFSNEYDKANENYKKALTIAKELDIPMGISISFINIAGVFQSKNQFDSAYHYFKKALEIQKNTINDPSTISNILNNMGTTSLKLGRLNEAKEYLFQSLNIYKEIKYDIGLAMVFVDLGDLFTELKNYQDAIKYYNKSEKISKEYQLTHVLRKVYKSKSEYFFKSNQFKNAFLFKDKFHSLNDSIVSLDSKKQIANIEAVYELEQTNAKLDLLNIENKYQKTIIKRQSQFQYLSIGVIITTLIIIILIIRLLRIKSRANKKILEQKNMILEQNEELRQQTEEIIAQRDQIEDQKDKIEYTHTELVKSIHYAKYIQGAALPTNDLLIKIIPEHFIFIQPQNVVGGDFYWVSEVEDTSIIAVADCTGHGVPGGFLSMLAMSLLNEIVNKEKTTKPAEILNKLRAYFIKSLHQNKEKDSIRDGMDINICAINTIEKTISFAGANNPAFICQNKSKKPLELEQKIENENYVLAQIPVNKMSISIEHKMIDFTQQTFNIEQIDCIYMFTDGFADQFGGKDNKKFLRSNFKKLILENSAYPFNDQKLNLSKRFKEWKNTNDQFDDVLVLGFKPKNLRGC